MVSDITLLHNPRCSKSRGALALLEEAGHSPKVVRYLQTPLDADELDALCRKLGVEPADLIRWKDAASHGITRDAASERKAGLDVLAANPALMERPVVIRGERAVIARPPEALLVLLD